MTHGRVLYFLLAASCTQEPLFVSDVDLSQRDPDLSAAEDAATDASVESDAGPDASAADLTGGADAAILEAVSHPRELRAIWVTTVFRLDFPSSTVLSEPQARSELGGIVDVAAAAGLNAIFFQVRPESDALYTSTLEPWSRFVSGTQGSAPAYDPLVLLIELAHAKGLEVHAWMNPYRGLVTPGSQTVALHVTQKFPQAAITYNGTVTMNPADTGVRDHLVAVVADVTKRFDIDGVVFDDYFYPYPDMTAFPDDASYQAYVDGGGLLGKSDWRRSNVNTLISMVADAVRTEKSWVRWGVAPFGIYRPNMPSGVTGLDAYEVLACDSVHWMSQGWVDYLAPQLYWTSISSGQPFGALVDWWASQALPGHPIFPSLALYKLGTAPEWTRSELELQVALSRAESPAAQGQTWFRHGFLEDDVQGVSASFQSFYAAPARPPVVPALAAATLAPPAVSRAGDVVTVGHTATVRGFPVYRRVASAWSFERYLPAGSGPATLASGSYAISAIDRGGVESLGVQVTIP